MVAPKEKPQVSYPPLGFLQNKNTQEDMKTIINSFARILYDVADIISLSKEQVKQEIRSKR